MPLQLYEAVVTDEAPKGAPKGHIKCKIPELFGEDEVPLTIAPLYPGWTAGGWHSIPSKTKPRLDENVDVRVIIVKVGPESFRWIGTSQGFPLVEDSPGTIAGARSGDGDHFLFVDNTGGIIAYVSSDQDRDGPKNYLSVGTDDTIRMGTFDGSVLGVTKEQVYAQIASGSGIIIDANNGIQLFHSAGKEGMFIENGLVKVLGTEGQMTFGGLQLVSGVVNVSDSTAGLGLVVGSIKADVLLAALKVALDDIILGLAAVPYTATAATTFSGTLADPLWAPYLSTVLKHT